MRPSPFAADSHDALRRTVSRLDDLGYGCIVGRSQSCPRGGEVLRQSIGRITDLASPALSIPAGLSPPDPVV
jgi:hypothetical protein